MNPEFNEWLFPNLVPAPASARFDWRCWARRLLVCNPFFLCSAALLLFGVNRISIDPNFLSDEKSNLLFNYFALQIYEALVVVTAIVLARRKIWYDSALLVVVENGLVLVPFMLISQGTLVDPALGVKLAVGAFVLAAVRAFVIRRGYPQFNLPLRALALGAALLLFNAILPAVFPSMVEKDVDDWMTPNLVLWYVALPLFVAAANLLPRPARYGGLNPERHWLPLFNYALWVVGTGAHIWCLGYISKQPFHLHYIGPAAVVAAWTLWHRIGDCVVCPGPRREIILLSLTFLAPLISFGEPALFELLVVVNFVAYAVLMPRRSGTPRTLLRELAFASLGMLLLNVPEEIGRVLLPAFARSHPAMLALATMICISSLRRLHLPFGLAGSVAAMVLILLLRPTASVHLFIETSVVFLLAHSLAWRKDTVPASFLRALAGSIWIIDAGLWVHQSGWRTGAGITGIAIAFLTACVLLWRFKHRRQWIVGLSATAVTLAVPSDWLIRQDSPGLLALTASLAVFAIGFVAAWTRHRWERANGCVP